MNDTIKFTKWCFDNNYVPNNSFLWFDYKLSSKEVVFYTIEQLYKKYKDSPSEELPIDIDSVAELGWQKRLSDRGMSDNYGASFIKEDKSFPQANYELSFWRNTSRVRINRINGVVFDGIIKYEDELRNVMEYLQIPI